MFLAKWTHNQSSLLSICGILLCITSSSLFSQTINYFQTGEEFCGPFTSWKNIKTDFGVKGDGITDDAPAISAILNIINSDSGRFSTLYFPAGTYLIKSTVTNLKRNGTMTLVGEDPATTIIMCSKDFTSSALGQGAIFRLDGTYGSISRMTFEGNGKPEYGLLRDGGYGTDWRITDMIFNNIKGPGIQWGGASDLGEDLSVMVRCRFKNCGTGIFAKNQNCIGPYAWYCLFEDCGVGIDNYVGFIHSIGNVFLRSKECDIQKGYIGYMILNNTSVNSKCFLGFIEEKTNCMANGNKIYNTTDPVSFTGVSVMLDNIVRSRTTTGPAVLTGKVNTLMVGNTFTVPSPVQPTFVPSNAIDNNLSTACFDPNCLKFSALPRATGGYELIWRMSKNSKCVVNKYTITNGEKPLADPKDFQLQGSQDGNYWTALDLRTNQTWTRRQEKRTFTFVNTQAYAVYRLYVTANQNVVVNYCGDQKAGVEVAEWEMFDAQGKDITDDKSGTIAGRVRDFSTGYTSIDEKVVDPATITVPATIDLPGVPENKHRKVFEVALKTGNDAQEIQQKITAAAKEPKGSNPIVHFSQGHYELKTTVVVPANTSMQLVGDAARDGSAISWNGKGRGPLFKIEGPTRVTMKDLVLATTTADGIFIENCDQPGGRIYCDQVDVFGGYGEAPDANTDFLIDGVEHSDVTVVNQYIGSATNGVLVKGGPILASGGQTKGQISFLMGYIWGDYSPTFLNVVNGGRLLFCGYRAENSQQGLVTLDKSSSGMLTWACNNDAVATYTNTPFIIKDFKGTVCNVANVMWPNKVNVPMYDISGDGSKTKILSMCNNLGGGLDAQIPVKEIWKDTTFPAAQAAMTDCQGIFSDWNWKELPNVYQHKVNAKPDAAFIRECLQQLRDMRLEPPTNRAEGVTDIKLIHMPIDVGADRNGVVMRAGKQSK